MENPADLFNEEWINEKQAILMAMIILECSVEEAIQTLADFRAENPSLVFKEQ